MGALVDFRKEYQNSGWDKNDMSPTIVHKYSMLACLKWTENKQVYLIEGKADNKKYVLKCVSNKSHERLEEEYELHHTLQFKGLVPAVEFIKDTKQSYFIRDYVEGNTITDLIEMTKDGYLPEEQLIDITVQLCQILNYLHTQTPPIIHRDIKPDNIIYTKQGECKLIDFGISRRFSNEQEKDTVVIGTKFAAPPEQYGFMQTDARSDIYSLGVLMYYMATGNLDISEMKEYSISTNLKKCIQKCTEFSPRNRFQSVKQLKARLLKFNSHRTNKIIVSVSVAIIIVLVLMVTMFQHGMTTGSSSTKIASETNDTVNTNIVVGEDNISEYRKEQSTDSVYEFSSSLIESAVRHELGKSKNDVITLGDLDQIEELYICGEQIYDLWDDHFVYGKWQYMNVPEYNQTGLFKNQGDIETLDDLSYMKNLHTLTLYNQNIKDLTPLRELKNLTCLGLGANNIEDLSVLEGLTKLKTLDLSGNPITDSDMNHLCKLPCLVDLDLGDTQITNVSIIKEMKLKSLSIYNDRLMDCQGIEIMTSLEKLIISGVNGIITEKGLANIVKLSNLTELRIMGGGFNDLSVLRKLTSLTYLDLCSCNIDSFDELIGMNLTTLIISGTKVKDLSAIKNFKELTNIGINNISCKDYTPLLSLPKLKYITCDKEQVKIFEKQFGNISFQYWIS